MCWTYFSCHNAGGSIDLNLNQVLLSHWRIPETSKMNNTWYTRTYICGSSDGSSHGISPGPETPCTVAMQVYKFVLMALLPIAIFSVVMQEQLRYTFAKVIASDGLRE